MVNIESLVELVSKEIERRRPNRPLIKSYLDLIQEESTRDPLVGLKNKSYGERALERAKLQTDQLDIPFSFFMFDVIDLKYYNNTYARKIGDLAIQSAAQFLLKHTRRKDELFRYGDSADEFGLILRKADKGSATTYKRRIKEKLKGYTIKFRHRLRTYELPLGLHIGHSTYYPGLDLQEVILEANEMMNKSKT